MERQDSKTAKNAKSSFREPPEEVDALAHAIIGAAIEVHRELGPGFLESTYEEAMAIELYARGLTVARQISVSVEYKGMKIGESRIDLLVNDLIVVELKAVEQLRPVHTAQVLSYLRAGAYPLGLLFNFNVYTLRDAGIRRIIASG